MDDPVRVPEFLASPPDGGCFARGDRADRVFRFDPESQAAPGCPDFEGVHLLPDFVSGEESRRLLRAIESVPFALAQSGKQKQHYGARVNFNKRRVNVAALEGLPSYAPWLESRLRRRLAAGSAKGLAQARIRSLEGAIARFRTTDVFVLRYRSGDQSNLDFHVDDTFAYGEAILDLSLETDSVLTFLRDRRASGRAWECVRVPIPARSMLVLYGPARFEWEHAVLAYDVHGQRTSITARTLGDALRESPEGRCVAERARWRLAGETIEFELDPEPECPEREPGARGV